MSQVAELKQQIELLCIERGLEPNEVMKAIETAIAAAVTPVNMGTK